jgi:hypothetical protein
VCQYAGWKQKKYGPTPYSPALTKQKTICQLLKIVVHRQKMGTADDEATADIYRKLHNIGITLPEDQDGCKQAHKNHLKELTVMMTMEKHYNTKRQEFQEEMITKAINAGDKDRASRIRRIQRAEILKAVWSKCAAARGQHKNRRNFNHNGLHKCK